MDANTVFFSQEKLYSELMAPRRHLDPGMSDKKTKQTNKKNQNKTLFKVLDLKNDIFKNNSMAQQI